MGRTRVPATLGYGDSNSEERLICPVCSGTYLHQGEVQTFFRGEDEDQTKVTVSNFEYTQDETISNDLTLNPSYRRHGLRISFWCENCQGGKTDEEADNTPSTVGDLCIYQHKGETFVEWELS